MILTMIVIFHSLYITFGGGGGLPQFHIPYCYTFDSPSPIHWETKRVSITKFPLHAISSLISSPLPSPTPSCS